MNRISVYAKGEASMHETPGFQPGWLRAQIQDSINELKNNPRFSKEVESFCPTEEQVNHSSLLRRSDEREQIPSEIGSSVNF